MRVPDGPGEAPEELLGGCKMLIFTGFYSVFTLSMPLAFLLMFLVRGGAGVLPKCALGRRLGRQEGSMRVPDGPGEAPEGLLGGCKMLFFHCFL